MVEAKTVSKWFIKKNPYLVSGYIDENTKLNKLLYFANLYSFAVNGEAMMPDSFIAFPNGPVIFDIYKDYRYNGLSSFLEADIKIDENYLKILNVVNFVYGNMKKDELVDLSHTHNVWNDVKECNSHNHRIVFENADKKLIEKCKEIYKAYENVNFELLKKEVINGNVFYYYSDNIETLTDSMIEELMTLPEDDEAHFIELMDGELIVS